MYKKKRKREPKGANGRQKGPKGCQKGAKGSQKGAKREPKGAKGEPKVAKGEPKDDQIALANLCPKKGAKKGTSSIYFLVNFGAILEAKNIQKPL